MDNTSIITQVTNPKEEEILSSNAEKGERCFCVLKLLAVARFVSVTHHFKRAGCEPESADKKHFRHFITVCTNRSENKAFFVNFFNMLLYDSVLLLMQNDDRVCLCLYNGVVVKAQCKLLETESFGLCQRRSPVMWMETNINMFLSVTRQKFSGRIA